MVFVDVIYGDDEELKSSMESAHDTYDFFTIQGQAFDCVSCSSRIVFIASNNSTVQHGFFDIEYIKIVLRHLFHGVNGDVVLS